MRDNSENQKLLTRLISELVAFAPDLRPQISIITPTWNTKSSWFLDLALSILQQTVLDWEWCIVDDCSSDTEFHYLFAELERLPNIKILKLPKRVGISGATNRGLALATALYSCCVDHDDLLTRDALACTLQKHEEGFDAVYSDSDKVDESGVRSEPFHKPDWSPELFRGVMYVGHLLSFQRELAIAAGGFDSRFDGVQDFEFFLRFSESSNKIGHIAKILYHWRAVPGSVAAAADAKGDVGRLQRAAVQAHLDRLRLNAIALPGNYPHRVRIAPAERTNWPKISIVIPTRDSPEILAKCLYSLFSKTTYPDFEVLCVDNETTDARALEEMRIAPVVRILLSGAFNFSKANNLGKKFTSGEYLVFMNNDVEVVTPGWLEEMLYYAEQDDVGAVGALLLYPDKRVQHAGVILGCRGTADHVLRNVPGDADGYAGSLSCAREVSAATAACLMTPRDVFDQVGGFNEHFFTAYQDVDLCLKIRNLGKRIIFTPHAQLIHHESVSRGRYYDFVDRNLLLDYWEPLIKAGDPYYNPNFDVQACDYTLATKP
jgi:GT2 family glycosyltransferase